MALTREFRETVVKHVQENPAFLAAMVAEAARNAVEGDMETALAQLRDITNATMGFDALSAATDIPKTSLMRMLSGNGNPSANNLALIMKALHQKLNIRISVHAEIVLGPVLA